MPAPGSEVVERQSPPARSTPIQSGSWFIAGLSERGSTKEAVTCRNLQQFESVCGGFVSYGMLYSAADVFFREGGSVLNVTRVVGPAAKAATITAKTAGGEGTLKATASNQGEWGNHVSMTIAAGEVGGKYTITVVDAETGKTEKSPELENNAAAVVWAQKRSKLVVLEDLGKGNPAVGKSELKEGADDRASVTDAHWKTSLERFTKVMGPGQVSMPGRTTDEAYKAQLEHALGFNRVALLDGTDTSVKATLIGDAAVGRELGIAGGKGGLFGSWHIVPGIAPGTTRTVPQSCVEAGILARLATQGYTPNKPGAGEKYGQSRYAIGLSQPEWTEAVRGELNEAGVNVAVMNGDIAQNMGFRTMVDPLEDETWLELGNARLYMEIAAKSNQIANEYVFEEIDGKGLVFAKMNGQLRGMLLTYFTAGSLYGEEPAEAFYVDTGAQVNTPETIAERKINAIVEVRMSHMAEFVKIEISKIATTEAVA